MKTNFFYTIRFKLALVFTVILFIFSSLIIFSFNIAINNYLSTREKPPVELNVQNQQQPLPPPKENKNQEDKRALYTSNLENIQSISIISLLPLAMISFLLGLYLSYIFLKPLQDLNTQIDSLKTDTLGKKIELVSNDEVGKIIKSFNEMSERLQGSFEQQARFVQDASHELRTPLTIVRTNLETMLDDEKATKREIVKSIKETLNDIDAMTKLANDLLTLSKPQSTKRTIESIINIVQECLNAIGEFAVKKCVKLEIEFRIKEEKVLIHKNEFKRAIINVLENAIKYAQTNKSPKVDILLYKKEKEIQIEIRDNGKGIPIEDQSKIFDRFYRVDSSRDRETGGFGLGLAITKKIVQEHFGDITIKSKPGQTIFTIILPIL